MDGSTFTLALGTDGLMQRRIGYEDHKLFVDKSVAGGVCRQQYGQNVPCFNFRIIGIGDKTLGGAAG